MNSLQKSLEQFMQEHKLQGKVEVEINETLSHPQLVKWWQHYPQLSREDLLRSIIKVKQYVKEQDHCTGCQGLHQCNNLMKGHVAQLFTHGKMLELSYSPCSYFKQADQNAKRSRLIKSHHIPKDIMGGSFRDFDKEDDQRLDAFNAVIDFCLRVQPGQDPIGLYLYGPLGVGKSYLLGAACNELARRGIASFMVYTPEFFREMKGAIAEQKVDDKLKVLKEIPVLIFDDMGAESISAWARDEVLGAILQYRVMEQLPTLYTSNYSYEQLEDHLAYSQKGGIEQLKAKRIMERIRHYTDAYFVSGSNRRTQR